MSTSSGPSPGHQASDQAFRVSGAGWGRAWLGGCLAEGVVRRSNDPAVLDGGAWWAVVITFEGDVRLYRFDEVTRRPLRRPAGAWPGPGEWTTSLDEPAYRAGGDDIRRRIRAGEVYQVNLCRVMSAPVGPGADP